VYRVLDALERRGFIEECGSDMGRQPRTRYRARAAGVRAYQANLLTQLGGELRLVRLVARELSLLERRPRVGIELLDVHAASCVSEGHRLAAGIGGPDAALAERLEAAAMRDTLATRLAWIATARSELGALAVAARVD
jgi:hypothetical protein